MLLSAAAIRDSALRSPTGAAAEVIPLIAHNQLGTDDTLQTVESYNAQAQASPINANNRDLGNIN